MLSHKVKKFLHKNFRVNGVFSSHEFDQTDFGRIYFNLPEITEHPKTIEELATTLKHYNHIGKPVKIRNTGHSINGQTLTDGVQINIGAIDHVSFNERKMEVTAGAGASWDKVLKTVKFPKYCLPIFPNNPGQQIHIGGTAAVGGVGAYSWKYGGFWNHVVSLKLVTMSGGILHCDRVNNPEYFKYALGGYGRIGVIAELTIKILPSPKKVFGMVLITHNKQDHYEIIKKASSDISVTAVLSGEQFSGFNFLSKHGLGVNAIFLIFEPLTSSSENFQKEITSIKQKYREPFYMFLEENPNNEQMMDVSFHEKLISKHDLVYWYPQSHHQPQLDLIHPWADYILPPDRHPAFMKNMIEVIAKYELEDYILQESFLHEHLDACILPSYGIKRVSKNPEKDYPLCLDFPGQDYSYISGLFPVVPSNLVEKSIKMVNELTDLAYELGGKRYLYGIHNLKKSQVLKQYGTNSLHEWQKIKDELDPKHLLNIGVIEHLD